MFRTCVAIVALSWSAFALADTTATLTRIEGEVMVNQGEQFVPARAGLVLVTGDRILVPQGGSSTLTYDDGCVIDVPSDTLVVIPDSSACAVARANTPPAPAPAPRVAAAATASEDSALGWAYLGTVLGVVLFYGDEDDDDTASP